MSGISTVKLAKQFDMSSSGIWDLLKRNNIKLRSNKVNSLKFPVENPRYFEHIDEERKAYFLGFILADGYITIRKQSSKIFGLAINTEDEYILYALLSELKTKRKPNRYTSEKGFSKNTAYSRIIIPNDDLVDDLIDKGIVEHKTKIARVYDHKIPKDLRRHFIRGYLDGDGSIRKCKKKNSYKFEYDVNFVGTDEVLTWIHDIFISEKLIKKDLKLEKRMPHHTVSSTRYGGNLQAERIMKYIYSGSTIYLKRKYERYLSLIEQNKSHV